MSSAPCQTCGWKFPGFHICVDPKSPLDPHVARKHGIALKGGAAAAFAEMDDVQKRRLDEYKAGLNERDIQMIDLYVGGLGMKKICAELGAGLATVMRVLKRAQEAGVVTIRPRGLNNRFYVQKGASDVAELEAEV